MKKYKPKNYLIVNVTREAFTVQVNKRDDTGDCYNLIFKKGAGYTYLDGFMITAFLDSSPIPIYGSRDTRTIAHCIRTLPKIMENCVGIGNFLERLIKKEKLGYYQVNINADMSHDNSKKIGLTTIADILKELVNFDFSLNFSFCFYPAIQFRMADIDAKREVKN